MPRTQIKHQWKSLTYDRTKFRSQIHLRDPKPCAPRWISGYGYSKTKRAKKFVTAPKTEELKLPSKRSFQDRVNKTTIHLDHKIHKRSR